MEGKPPEKKGVLGKLKDAVEKGVNEQKNPTTGLGKPWS